MPIYGNYQGAVREITPIYGNKDGVTKALGAIYGNRDGVVTPIYQPSHINIPYWTYDVNDITITLKTYTGYTQAGIKDIVIDGSNNPNYGTVMGAISSIQRFINSSYKYINSFTSNNVRIQNMCNMFRLCQNMRTVNIPNEDAKYVDNMSCAYYNCYNLIGKPVCYPNTKDMGRTYAECQKIGGQPVCGDMVINMYHTYYNCKNLTGNPVCGPNVQNMVNTYYNCIRLTGSPACGDSVINMANAYSCCVNLTGRPACGQNVQNMHLL